MKKSVCWWWHKHQRSMDLVLGSEPFCWRTYGKFSQNQLTNCTHWNIFYPGEKCQRAGPLQFEVANISSKIWLFFSLGISSIDFQTFWKISVSSYFAQNSSNWCFMNCWHWKTVYTRYYFWVRICKFYCRSCVHFSASSTFRVFEKSASARVLLQIRPVQA